MSDNVLKIIPAQPAFVPAPAAIQTAKEALARMVQSSEELKTFTETEIIFVDPGTKLEQVFCPFCNAILDEWWNGEMEKAFTKNYSDLTVTVPCCGKNTTLNDLRYEWPAGFARFIMEARNPKVFDISDQDLEALENILGTKLRKVKAHY